jgi:pyruvate/2-oxoglutarate dehydrogenase complex dihydrolipoamide dehydrogenase (E3) component
MIWDLAVIGAGAAGTRAAIAARDAGMSVTLVDQAGAGGTINLFGQYAFSRALQYLQGTVISYTNLCASLRDESRQYAMACAHRLKAMDISILNEPVSFSSYGAKGFVLKGVETTLYAQKVLLATGTLPALPDIPHVDACVRNRALLSEQDILGSKKLAKSVTVLGGSFRASQLAVYYCLLGVPVTLLLEPTATLTELDSDLNEQLRKALEEIGVRVLAISKLVSVVPGKIHCTLPDGTDLTLETQALHIGGNRVSSTRGLGLSVPGVLLNAGAVQVDAKGQTNIHGIYAAGDCTSLTRDAQSSSRMAETVVAGMLGKLSPNPRYSRTSYDIVGQICSAGDTMESALSRRMNPVCIKLPLPFTEFTPGLIKLVGSRSNRQLIGVHLIGDKIQDLFSQLVAIMESSHPLDSTRLEGGTLAGEIAGEALFRLRKVL